MENNLEVIPIFFAVDDGYSPFLAVALHSLIDNASKNYFYSIKILYTHIKEENKKKILKYKCENVEIEFVDLNYYINKIQDKLYTRDYYTKTTYFRLFMPDLYPQYKKAVYLDSDIVVLGDISEFYFSEINDNLIAAVPDGIIQNMKVFQDYAEKVVGVSSYKHYFNAGILLMNLDELRKFRFQHKFLYLLETIKFKVAQDQDYLNRLCKGRVKILDDGWDVMPIPDADTLDEDRLKIVHYNMFYKPWHNDSVKYEEYFWRYAEKTEYFNEIKEMKSLYTQEQKFNDMEIFKNLKLLAKKESDCVGDDRLNQHRKDSHQDKSKDRLNIIAKIEDLEKHGIFDIDPEDDPPTIELKPDDIDYLSNKSSKKLKTAVANNIGKVLIYKLIKDEKLIIKEIKGIENLKNIKGGAIITCNHFNPFDSLAIEKACLDAGILKVKKLYKVIREGNYTNFPGLYGFFFRNCDTLPLSSNTRTMIKFMSAVNTVLENGDFILIYPEQSMWWNYRKPKPLKPGAFKIAARNNVPVIPIFITMEDSDKIGNDGFPVQAYTLNIDKPIYPDRKLSTKENTDIMKEKNYSVWKNIYEDFYSIPLEYSNERKED